MGRILRRVAHRTIRALFRARLLVVLVLGLLLVAGAFGIFQSGQTANLSFSLPGPKRAPDSTEQFLKGNQTFSADLICTSLSDETLDRLRARGAECRDVQQQQLQLAKEKGAKLEQINYVGGQPLPDGTSLQFYVVATRGPTARPDLDYVTYIFTLDRAGKISRIQ
jgi:hypothetical protein